jgi:putative ABC transport system permease protein
VIIAMHVTPQGIDPEASRPGEPQAQVAIVSGRYFETVRIPLRSGRAFNNDDREGGTPVVIVSESVANRYFPNGALYQRVLIPEIKFNITGSGERWIACEIVGVVGDVLGTSISDGGVLHLYLPESQNAIRFTYLAVRTDRDPVSLVTAVKRAVYSEVPDLPVADLRSLEDRAAFLTDPPLQGMWLLSVFSAVARVLASIGVYGIMTSAVAQRWRELGIRSALGATPGQIVRLIAGEGFRLMAAGFLLGIAGSLALTRTLEHLLYGVTRTDALAFGSAALALIFAGLLAGLGPAKASASVDPAKVLRAE